MNPVAPKMVTSVLRAAAILIALKRRNDLGQITRQKPAARRPADSPTDESAKNKMQWSVFWAP